MSNPHLWGFAHIVPLRKHASGKFQMSLQNPAHVLLPGFPRWSWQLLQYLVHSPKGTCIMPCSSYLYRCQCSEAGSGVENTDLGSKGYSFKSWWYRSLPSWATLGELICLILFLHVQNGDHKAYFPGFLERLKGNGVMQFRALASCLAQKKSQ